MTIAAMFPAGFATASARRIVRAGHPALARRAAPVTNLADPALFHVIAAMQAALALAGGVGLAAPQIAVPLRVILFKAPEPRLTGLLDDVACDDTIVINPAIEPIGPERDGGWEGCLSLPGLRGWVPRWRRIRYTGLTPAGDRIDRQVAGFHARVVQHEHDHLEGCLYPQRMEGFSRFGFVDEMIAAEQSSTEAE